MTTLLQIPLFVCPVYVTEPCPQEETSEHIPLRKQWVLGYPSPPFQIIFCSISLLLSGLYLQALQYPIAVTCSFRRPPADSDGPVQTRRHKVWVPSRMADLLAHRVRKVSSPCTGIFGSP